MRDVAFHLLNRPERSGVHSKSAFMIDEAPHRIANPRVIALMLTRHYHTRGRFCLAPVGLRCQSDTTMVGNDQHARYFLVDALPRWLGETIEAAPLIEVRGSFDSVYTWFLCDDLQVVEEHGDRYYEIPYPKEIFQIQRRDAFRIRVPPKIQATLDGTLRYDEGDRHDKEPKEIELSANVVDLSATGLAILANSPELEAVPMGTRIEQGRLRVHQWLDIRIDAEIRNKRPGPKNEGSILGMQFAGLPLADAQAVARTVIEIQRKTLLDAES